MTATLWVLILFVVGADAPPQFYTFPTQEVCEAAQAESLRAIPRNSDFYFISECVRIKHASEVTL